MAQKQMFVWSCSETEAMPSGQEPSVLPDEWYRDTEEKYESIRVLPRLHCITFISKAFVQVQNKAKHKQTSNPFLFWKYINLFKNEQYGAR